MRTRTPIVTATVLAAVLTTGAGRAVAAPPPQPSPDSPAGIEARAMNALAAHKTEIRGGEGQEFRVTGVLTDKDGTTHTRIARTFNKLPVLGGDMIVHQSAGGAWRGASLTVSSAPQLATTPKITAAAAKLAARTPGHTGYGEPALLIDARGRTARLAWQVPATGTQADGTPSRLAVRVDAQTGKVIDRGQQVTSFRATDRAGSRASAAGGSRNGKDTTGGGSAAAASGDGQSLYSGTVPLQTTQSGSSYQLKDPTRGDTYTSNMRNGWDGSGTLFTDADNHWGDGTTGNAQTVGVDAQYGTDQTWDFYKNTFGRNGIGNDGKGSSNRVHYGQQYANAFWDDSCFCMTYGDGDGRDFGPLTSIDVAGHEMSHGVTSRSANLEYASESGGLNEATSDIFATVVEFFSNNTSDAGDYLIGEKIVKAGLGQPALRFMDKPSKDGSSADYWSPNLGNLDVHYSSGVANHFFYLVSEGSGAKTINGVAYDSPTSNGSTVTGIGRDAATKIWYRALTVYMTANTNYAGARTATLNAANDLYGAGSPQSAGVAAAWSAVNVN